MSAKRIEPVGGPTLEMSDIQATVLRPRPSPYKGEYVVLRIDEEYAYIRYNNSRQRIIHFLK
jgi:hypothetical protein